MFVHLVWATWRRTPLISEAIEKRLYGAIRTRCLKLACPVVAVGGTADHVHLLVELHPSTPVAQLVGEAKGFSSFVMTHEIASGRFFRWQERYHQAARIIPEMEPSDSCLRSPEGAFASGAAGFSPWLPPCPK